MKGKSSSTEARAKDGERTEMLEKGLSLFLRTQDQPQMLGSVQRFRTVSNQPFLNRGTVRRGGLGVGSILRFAFELKNMLLHIFRLEAKASRSGRRKKDRHGKSRDRER
jgi:hypothetical protein